jgi:hypothetical protein
VAVSGWLNLRTTLRSPVFLPLKAVAGIAAIFPFQTMLLAEILMVVGLFLYLLWALIYA